MRQLVFYVIAALTCSLGAVSHGQLRIVDYNVAGLNDRSALTIVLDGFKNEVVNGVAKPIDVLVLNEVDGSDLTTMLGILNGQGVGSYTAAGLGSTTGAGSVGLIYRSDTVFLAAQQQVVDTSVNGAARGVMRYTLRPGFYDESANFYVYASHYKSGDTGNDADRRDVEATAIRANADGLGNGAHIIYAGDFNIYRSTEPMWDTLTGAGNGQAFDPINQIGNWHDGAGFRGVHTQNPAGSGFVGGGMDDRFDWQMVTGELLDNEGMSILSGSYHAFGNNGTHVMNGHINTGTGASPNVLNALGAASDHLPVVAQYQVPARMDFAVSVPDRVIVGGMANAVATARNSAGDLPIVASAIGADELDYSLTASGAISGTANGTDAAFGGGNQHSFQLDTATPGDKFGSISFVATSPQALNGVGINLFGYNVIDHANPSFSDSFDVDELTIDFGTVTLGSAVADIVFNIDNQGSGNGVPAKLELDSIVGVGDTSVLTTNLSPFISEDALSVGPARTFAASLSTAIAGSFSATYTLNLSDENLPGSETLENLTLTLTGFVQAEASGDFDSDGDIDGRDFLAWQRGESPNSLGPGDLDLWQAEYGSGPFVATVVVPEPSTVRLVALSVAGLLYLYRIGDRDRVAKNC